MAWDTVFDFAWDEHSISLKNKLSLVPNKSQVKRIEMKNYSHAYLNFLVIAVL